MDADYNYDSEEEVDYSKMDMVRNYAEKILLFLYPLLANI